MQQKKTFSMEPTPASILAAASKAYDELNNQTPHGGEVFILMIDRDRNVRTLLYLSPHTEGEEAYEQEAYDDVDICYEEVADAMRQGGHFVCLQVIPFGEPKIITLSDNVSVDDQAIIWSLMDDVPDVPSTAVAQ